MNDPQGRELTESMHRSAGSFELVLSPLLLGLLGFWADTQLGTRPVLTVLAVVLALAGAAIKIYYGYDREMVAHDEGKPWATRS